MQINGGSAIHPTGGIDSFSTGRIRVVEPADGTGVISRAPIIKTPEGIPMRGSSRVRILDDVLSAIDQLLGPSEHYSHPLELIDVIARV